MVESLLRYVNFSGLQAEGIGAEKDFVVLLAIGAKGSQGLIAPFKRDGVYGCEDAPTAGFGDVQGCTVQFKGAERIFLVGLQVINYDVWAESRHFHWFGEGVVVLDLLVEQ